MSAFAFDPIELQVATELESPGDTISRAGHIDVPEFDYAGHAFVLADGLDYDVALTDTGEGVLATGIVRGVATTPCDRCLEPATLDIAGEISCYYLNEPPEADDEDEEEYGLISAEGTVDISPAIQAAVVMDLPFIVLCREDCKGLCPTCGCNLNEQTCDCAQQREVDPMNPFAALASLHFDAPQDEEELDLDEMDDLLEGDDLDEDDPDAWDALFSDDPDEGLDGEQEPPAGEAADASRV